MFDLRQLETKDWVIIVLLLVIWFQSRRTQTTEPFGFANANADLKLRIIELTLENRLSAAEMREVFDDICRLTFGGLIQDVFDQIPDNVPDSLVPEAQRRTISVLLAHLSQPLADKLRAKLWASLEADPGVIV